MILADETYSIQGSRFDIMPTPPNFYQIFRVTAWLLCTVQCQEIAVHEENKMLEEGTPLESKSLYIS